MTISPTLESRRIVIAALKAAVDLTAIVPAGSIFPSKVPSNRTKPFIRLGVPENTVQRASCQIGGEVDGRVHVFVSVTSDFPDAEATCSEAVRHAADALDALPTCYVDRTTVIPDTAEADDYHGIVFYRHTLDSST